ncbi:arylsulfatase A-like enzyme [Ilumatobacter fluminis]|uniref:Arylsulfatase A-like enzyme n=1 Tax=Ilumatobacter fluminis TaxID=467091 RepID=A0A4R7I474_9ACTN|nr:arylsulfatase A-like enzyme [Ilumatobacter fluminis]
MIARVRQPNIVLINCDDLGYGDLGCYGSQRNDTPTLDRLAAEGMRFTDFYMASPVCSPSRGAMLTGCYPPRIGFGSFDGLPVLFPGQRLGLDTGETTLASMLRDAGYATQHVGKWHCGDQPEFLPTRHGFDHSFGIPYSNDMGRQHMPDGMPNWPAKLAEMGIAIADEYPPLPLLLDDEVFEQQPDQASLTARFAAESVRFIRANQDRPFFLYLAHIYVHLPIYVQQRFADASHNGAYGAAVASIDWTTDVILTELRRLGLDEDTIVIFTSDNGSRARDEGGSNEPLRGVKGETWDGGLRVPFIVRWPGRVPAGSVCSAVTSAIDLLPTFASLAGGALPDRPIDGHDITPLLDGADGDSDRVFAYYRGNALAAVRQGRWKLHVARGDESVEELYDLVDDVGETNDVSGEQPDVVAALSAIAESIRADLGDDRLGVDGPGRRSAGVVDAPSPLTTYDPGHPYFANEYDLSDRG